VSLLEKREVVNDFGTLFFLDGEGRLGKGACEADVETPGVEKALV
jgi:hypothetical protein